MSLIDARDFYAVLHGLRTMATDPERQRARQAAKRLTAKARDLLAGPTVDQVDGLLAEILEALDFAAEPDEAECRLVDWPGRPVQLTVIRGGRL